MNDPFPPEIQKRISEWLEGDYDENTKSQIRLIAETDPHSLIDAFYTDLTFGTGGLRGLMGIGSNRINIYTIRKATQGLANYLVKFSPNKLSVFIGFDSRNNSESFAEETARVLAGNNIHVYLLKNLRPTPFISFGCRFKKCSAAIMITASHNPAEYNGYKVYWSDGGQVVPPHDEGIIQEVEKIHSLNQVKLSQVDHPLIEKIDSELDQPYIDAIRPLSFFLEQNRKFGKNLKISYTSLHGTGITLAPSSLKDWGFSNLNYVEKQIIPDGNFPTVKFPNPEYPETLKLGIDQLQESRSDLLIANDPDADRVGVVVRHKEKPVILSGNEIAALCIYYICEILKKQNRIPPKGAFVTTIVSSDLIPTIARAYHLSCFEVLTGFKYIAEKIHTWEMEKNGYEFLFGAEESYGYLLGTVVRDKDAIISSCLIAEMALHAKNQEMTLVDLLHEIFKKFGIFREKQLSLTFEGKEGADHIHKMMQELQNNVPETFANIPVVSIENYEQQIKTFLDSKKTETLNLPKSNVLLFRLKDGSKVVIRPSGTEPKIKIYAGVQKQEFSSIDEGLTQCEKKLDILLADAKQKLHP